MPTNFATDTLPIDLPMNETAPALFDAAPVASDDAVRVALRLRECAALQGGRLLLFVPASSGDSAAPLVRETALALRQLREGPVLVVDLERTGGTRDPWVDAMRFGIAFVQPLASAAHTVGFLASPDFTALVDGVRTQYAYVLLVVPSIADAVESLIAAAACDGVVLSVGADRTTIAEIQAASRQLARVHANVVGFVMDRGTPRRRVRRT